MPTILPGGGFYSVCNQRRKHCDAATEIGRAEADSSFSGSGIAHSHGQRTLGGSPVSLMTGWHDLKTQMMVSHRALMDNTCSSQRSNPYPHAGPPSPPSHRVLQRPPVTSWPGTTGYRLTPQSLLIIERSEWQSPQASTATSTSSAPNGPAS